ncbi:MAG: TNT domain-containing protein [Segniliparus sp.]|uniref:TNT domain-containing protein n=1 Tax=Segniliparus sp. TaxID=2804064 RepID=UPI003F2FB1FE
MSVKAKAHSSAGHIDGKASKAKGTDPEAEVGVDAVGMGSFDPFQILSSFVLNLIEAHVPPVKHALDVVTVNEGAARQQAELWTSGLPGELMDQHGEMATVAAGVAANWTSSGDDTAASVEFLARHMALQELIRAVCKGCEGVGWLIGKATDLMVKVRDKIKQWVSELFAKIMERAAMALATSWIPGVDVATTAEFVIESAIRIANFLQDAYDLFTRVKDALNTAQQVMADLKDGIDQIHDILGAMGVDVPALTTLSKGVEAISAPINKAAEFANQVDDKIAPTAAALDQAAGSVDEFKAHKPDLKRPKGGHGGAGSESHDGHGGGEHGGKDHTPMQGPHSGHEGNTPHGSGGGTQHSGTSGGAGGNAPIGIMPKSPGGSHSGGGLGGIGGASKPLPHVDGKPVNPHQFAAMANHGKSGSATGGSQHGGTGATHGGAGTQHGGTGATHGGAGTTHGGAGTTQQGGTGAQHSGAGSQHSGAGLSAGSQHSGAGAATGSMSAAPVAEKQGTGTSGGPQHVSANAGGAAPSQGGQQHGGVQHSGANAGTQGGAPHAGANTGGGSGATGAGSSATSGSTSGDHGSKPHHAESKTAGGSEQTKPSATDPKHTGGTQQHHDEKRTTGAQDAKHTADPKHTGAQDVKHHDEKHAGATPQHHDEKHATSGQDAKHTGAGQQPVDHHATQQATHWQDSIHSGQQHGGDWDRRHDDPDEHKFRTHGQDYGQPLDQHGTAPDYPHRTDENARTHDLIRDHGAPWGRDEHGNPLDKNEYDRRYSEPPVPGENWEHPHYPPNAGAVPGTRVEYHSMDAFRRDYGSQLDRIGHPGGEYLGLRPEGVPASFEQRGLPVSSLGKPYHEYEFSGTSLPSNWKIEVSEIAPAFGREGGGTQVVVKNHLGNPVSVNDLKEMGIL